MASINHTAAAIAAILVREGVDYAQSKTVFKAARERAGLWAEVEPRIVQAESVRQALQFVETGNAEVGLVGKSSAAGAAVRVVAIDPALYDPIIQGLGIVARTRSRSAEAFSAFVLSAEGQKILADFGFKAPPAAR